MIGNYRSSSCSVHQEDMPVCEAQLKLNKLKELMNTLTNSECDQPSHCDLFEKIREILKDDGQRQRNSNCSCTPGPKKPKSRKRIRTEVDSRSPLNQIKLKLWLRSVRRSRRRELPSKKLKRVRTIQKLRRQYEKWKIRQIKKEYLIAQKARAQRHLIYKTMANNLISKIIFAHLSIKELLACSLVCKSWNENARRSLRLDRECCIKIQNSTSCALIQDFNWLIDRAVHIPFNGLYLNYTCNNGCSVTCTLDSSKFCNFLDKIRIKNLKLDLWTVNRDCPIFFVIRELFLTRPHHLESISIGRVMNTTYEPFNGLEHMFETTNNNPPPISPTPGLFPNLAKFNLNKNSIQGFGAVCRDIVMCSPNLTKFPSGIYPEMIESIMSMGKLDLVKEFHCKLDAQQFVLPCSILAEQEGLEINKLYMDAMAIPPQLLFPALLKLYEKCSHHLTYLDILQYDLALFIFPQILPCLPRVKEINLRYCKDCDRKLGLPSLLKIDYASKFPQLDIVRVEWDFTLRVNPAMITLFQPWINRTITYSCSTVTKLQISLSDGNNLNDEFGGRNIFTYFSQIFPNVKHLEIKWKIFAPNLWSLLWRTWPNLESISFNCQWIMDMWKNMDSIFTGISEENCRLLLETKEYETQGPLLKTDSSITDMKELKLFRFHVYHGCGQKCLRKSSQLSELLWTEVTAKCAFDLMPNCKIEFIRNSCPYGQQNCRLNPGSLEELPNFSETIYQVMLASNPYYFDALW